MCVRSAENRTTVSEETALKYVGELFFLVAFSYLSPPLPLFVRDLMLLLL
jgi:hypothetical protein